MAKRDVIHFSELVNLPHTVTPGVHPHWLYECPNCGMNYKTPKLYYSPKKGLGQCFRCESIVLNDLELTLGEAADFYGSFELDDLKPKKRSFSLNDCDWAWDFHESDKIVEYLTRKRGFSDDWLVSRNIRACSSPYFGVVIPDSRGDTCSMFQIRDMRPDPFLKYFNPSNCLKPLYGTAFLDGRDPISICMGEGVFSAWSSELHTGKPGFATYGKTITTEQLAELVDLGVNEVELAYDGGEWYAFERAAARIGKVASVTARLLPFGVDPNDATREQYLESPLLHMNEFALSLIAKYTKSYPANIAHNKDQARRLWGKIRDTIQHL